MDLLVSICFGVIIGLLLGINFKLDEIIKLLKERNEKSLKGGKNEDF